MCKDEPAESTTGDGVASTRAHLSSASVTSDSGSSGWSSRLPSPDPIISDPTMTPGRRIPRSPLAPLSHAESLMDMQIPQPSGPLQVGRKRDIDEVFDDSTPPSPDKLQRELDQQHDEAKEEAMNTSRNLTTSTLMPLDTHEPDSKRRKTLAYRVKPPTRSDSSHYGHGSEHGHADDSGRQNTVERQVSRKSNSPKNG
ncbi:uncharacterized protein CCOS01_09847 [Colletotrichum costaricense]|uniref:Uncharacterized protein n=1 Tax=Colletotrichum costaricense TaxID=1209916 RepID=A0AAI9YSH2_9PEZI|nr:uncharacterized protein CCOS01_09847 [Colletotrichum costaricense]KAK1522135.1 hypothetical protein CCOS01_09847 [Colletotrichum costaricense]